MTIKNIIIGSTLIVVGLTAFFLLLPIGRVLNHNFVTNFNLDQVPISVLVTLPGSYLLLLPSLAAFSGLIICFIREAKQIEI